MVFPWTTFLSRSNRSFSIIKLLKYSPYYVHHIWGADRDFQVREVEQGLFKFAI